MALENFNKRDFTRICMVKVIFEDPKKSSEIKKGMAVIDMHCHTRVSDGRDSAELMIKQAKKLGIGLSITDHNRISASLEACRKTFAIPGIELTSSDAIDVLVYFYKAKDLEHFYNKYIKEKHLNSRVFNLWKLKWNTEELLDHARKYNCVVSLAHPLAIRPKNSYAFANKNPRIIKKLDAIEVVNSLMHPEKNRIVSEWAMKLNKAVTGASDAHSFNFVGKAVTASYANDVDEFLDNIIKEKNIVVGKSLGGFSKFYTKAGIFKRNLKW